MTVAACPGCAATPLAMNIAQANSVAPGPLDEMVFSLPNIHCAACIRTVEDALTGVRDIAEARVNLSRRMVTVKAAKGFEPDAIVATLAAAGHEAVELNADALDQSGDPASRELLIYLALAGFAAMNVMLLSVSVWSGADDATRDFLHWISAAIALPALTIVSRPFYRSAFAALRGGRLNMDVPITLALFLAAASSLFETMEGGEHAYFDAALSLSFFLLLGRYLETRVRASARSAAAELTALETPTAIKISGDKSHRIATAEIVVGDELMIPVGERAPVDGVIIRGGAALDIGVITGESAPVEVGEGDEVAAGSLTVGAPLVMRVTAAGEDSSLRRTAALIAAAESARGRYVALADQAARIYAPVVHVVSLATFILWLWLGLDTRNALNIAISVLIITCPCALALAAPAVVTVATGRLFKAGVLLKSATALERLAQVDMVVFDKTGTLTTGDFTLTSDVGEADLANAAALAVWSSHPFCKALGGTAEARALSLPSTQNVEEVPGAGVKGLIGGVPAMLGSAKWVGAASEGGSETFLKIGDAAPVAFRFAPRMRDDVAKTISAIKAAGIDVTALSGDRQAAMAEAMTELGLTEWRAEVGPAEKMRHVEDLQKQGRRILMVGDGLNDAGALAGAYVSASPASAIEAARAASDIVLLGRSFTVLKAALVTAKTARRRIVQNFALAALYNMIAVPIAVLGFATPLVAAIAMSSSSIIVVLNAMRMK